MPVSKNTVEDALAGNFSLFKLQPVCHTCGWFDCWSLRFCTCWKQKKWTKDQIRKSWCFECRQLHSPYLKCIIHHEDRTSPRIGSRRLRLAEGLVLFSWAIVCHCPGKSVKWPFDNKKSLPYPLYRLLTNPFHFERHKESFVKRLAVIIYFYQKLNNCISMAFDLKCLLFCSFSNLWMTQLLMSLELLVLNK